MLLLIFVERSLIKAGKSTVSAPIAWTLDGQAFVIRDREELVQHWLPRFFPRGKFQSFTRKVYRWGFRQVNLPRDNAQDKDRHLVFANPCFQRDRRELMAHMRSVTAAGTRRQQQREPATPDTPITAQSHTSTQGISHASAPPQDGMVLPPMPRGPSFVGSQAASLLSLLGQQNPAAAFAAANSMAIANQHMHQFASLGFMPIDRHAQQQLMFASLLNSVQAPAANPAQIALPAALLLQAQLSSPPSVDVQDLATQETPAPEEQKESPESDADSQERLRRAAEILVRGVHPPRRGSSSGQDGHQGS